MNNDALGQSIFKNLVAQICFDAYQAALDIDFLFIWNYLIVELLYANIQFLIYDQDVSLLTPDKELYNGYCKN